MLDLIFLNYAKKKQYKVCININASYLILYHIEVFSTHVKLKKRYTSLCSLSLSYESVFHMLLVPIRVDTNCN